MNFLSFGREKRGGGGGRVYFAFFFFRAVFCLLLRTRFDYKSVCNRFATTHYVTAYKTIHMYYLKKSHDSLRNNTLVRDLPANSQSAYCSKKFPVSRICIVTKHVRQIIKLLSRSLQQIYCQSLPDASTAIKSPKLLLLFQKKSK
jgi:hypothetical protein